MNGCVYKTASGQCQKYSDKHRNTLAWCCGDNIICKDRKLSNADRFFRNATDEQLAQYMDKIASCEFCPARRERCGYGHGCIDAWLEWLNKEAEE